MKILSVKALNIPEIRVVRFARFCDERGRQRQGCEVKRQRCLPDPTFHIYKCNRHCHYKTPSNNACAAVTIEAVLFLGFHP